MAVTVKWEWSDDPQMVVEHISDTLVVRAHPSLSEAQVKRACASLDEHGPAVYEAWASASGLRP